MMRKTRRRILSSDEKALWDRVAQSVDPLDSRQRERSGFLVALSEEEARASTSGFASHPAREPTVAAVGPQRKAPAIAPDGPSSDISETAMETLWSQGIGALSDQDGDSLHLKKALKKGRLPVLAHGDAPGIDRRTANRFRKGRLPIDARLDLHGMTQEQAHIALHRFIESQHAMNARCVLVITGKGMRGDGVLRKVVPRWLNDARLRPIILEFNFAQIPDGGDGALYIHLKRRR